MLIAVESSLVGVWPLPADFPFVFEIVTGLLPVFQRAHSHVCLCTESCLGFCVCGPTLCLIIPGLCSGLSLGPPLATVKFPLQTARTMQTLPRLSTTSASPLAAIYRPQPQVYLCLRHPIISFWCCRKKSPLALVLGKCVTDKYWDSLKFPLPVTKQWES